MDTEYLPPCCKNAVEVAVNQERKRIVGMLRKMAKKPCRKRVTIYYVPAFIKGLANRIEESKR